MSPAERRREPEDPLRILFAGTPEIACFSLSALIAGHGGPRLQLVGVLSNPDRPAGRGRALQPSPVTVLAREAGLPVLQPERLDAAAREAVAELRPDVLAVVAYGRIFGPRFLALFPQGGVNLHPSLLPRHRGPSPLQAAILAGDPETGVTIQYLAAEMDAGDIIRQERVALSPETGVSELHDDLGRRGSDLLIESLRDIAAGTVSARPQDHAAATYCRKLTREDGQLSWDEPAEQIVRMVRALTPWPGVRCAWDGTPVQITDATRVASPEAAASRDAGGGDPAEPGRVLRVDSSHGILVQTTDSLLGIRRLKLQARKEMDFRAFVNGNPQIIGSTLRQA